MAAFKLGLTRDQLAAFLQDHEQIKQFENLFSLVSSEVAPNAVTEATILAGSADARAQQAVDSIERLTIELDVATTSPAQQANNSNVTDYIDLNKNSPRVGRAARMAWNSTDETLDLGMENGVTQQVGQEQYARVQNNTGALIPNGSVVGFVGATANAILVAPFLANGSATTLSILGVMTHDLPDSGQKGYCTTFGFVRDLNTSAFAVGDGLYASPTVAGALTNVKPTAPNNVVPLAICVVSHATQGVIGVRPTIEQQQYYGEFSKTGTVSPAAVNTSYAVSWDSTEIANGISIVSSSRLTVVASGLYQFDATLQLSSGSSSAKTVRFWYKHNGTNETNTTRIITTDINNGFTPIAMTNLFSMAAGDYIELWWQSDDVNVSLVAAAAAGVAPNDYPAAPAALMTITQVQQ